jgi:hypothetical protein
MLFEEFLVLILAYLIADQSDITAQAKNIYGSVPKATSGKLFLRRSGMVSGVQNARE